MTAMKSKVDNELDWDPENPHIWTFSGVKFYLLKPYGLVNIIDIAHALSNICRYGGHTATHYSVAEHSILVSQLLESNGLGMQGLLHDAAEAYLGDVVSPLKRMLGSVYADIYFRVDQAIAATFNCDYRLHPEAIHKADRSVLLIEKSCPMLMETITWNPTAIKDAGTCSIIGLSAINAKEAFLDRYYALRMNEKSFDFSA